MKALIEEIGQHLLEALPVLFMIGIIAALVFGGTLADFLQLYATWQYGG